MIDVCNKNISISRQCELLMIPRSTFYYEPVSETPYNLQLMDEIDRLYLDRPFYGSRSMTEHLNLQGHCVNRKRVSRLMKKMGIQAIYPKPKKGAKERVYGKFPYLLGGVKITEKNQAWGTDITYIPLRGGYLYLSAVIDLYSRYVLSWRLSNNLESNFCIEAVKNAFQHGVPQIMNSDQGVQFTSLKFIETLQEKGVSISMSGKGRCWDNIFVERFWRSLKYEEVYLKHYQDAKAAYESIGSYIELYNNGRVHSSLNYRTPAEMYLAA